jgi:hypothetical protein
MTVSEIKQGLLDETVERACKCTLPDSIEIAILAVLNKAADASREIVLARCYERKVDRDKVRRPLVDVAAAALLMVTRMDAGEWPEGKYHPAAETDGHAQ